MQGKKEIEEEITKNYYDDVGRIKIVFVHICFDIYKLLWSKKAEITFRT